MAELIKTTDSLNDGRKKLNDAITDSNAALSTANTAKQTANLAKAESESTQTQLDTIVIEGDSSVEAAQARVNNSGTAFPTLKQRLDAENQEVTAQLQQTEQNLNAQLAQIDTLENFEVRSNRRKTQPLIVFTLDDGGIHDIQTIRPILSNYGYPASSAIITNQVGNPAFPYTMTWQQIRELQNVHGWEIASHATDDVDLTTLTAQQVDDKLRIAKETLVAQGLECHNFFLPRGNYNDTIKQISRKYYRSTRISGAASTGATVNTSPFDMYQVDCRFFGDSTGVGQSIDSASGKPYDSVDYFKYYIDQAIAQTGVLVIGMHGNTLMQNNRQSDLDLICQYIQSKVIPVVTYNEMLNRVGNIVETPDFKVGADGKIGGLYGKIKVGAFNDVLNSTPIKDISDGYVNVSTIGNSIGTGLPYDNGGTMVSVKPDNDLSRSFQLFKPYGKDKGLSIRDFSATEKSVWNEIDVGLKAKINSEYTLPNIVSGRVTGLTGGFIKIENMVHINVKFTAAITGNGVLPLANFPFSTVAKISQVALSAINVTDMTTTYAFLTITSGQLTANLTSGKEYVISGSYSLF